MRTIRASEIGTYLFCQRAWWYQNQGLPSENQADLASGSELHLQHGRSVLKARIMRIAALVFLLAALVLLTIYVTGQIL